MQQLDIPIIHKTYDLFRALHELERTIPKMERFTVWQRSQNLCLDMLQGLLSIGYQAPERRADGLLRIASSVDMLRVFLRLSFDVKAINQKRYIALQEALDEIGRMLGGWIKSVKQK
jgi:hypothetical protein